MIKQLALLLFVMVGNFVSDGIAQDGANPLPLQTLFDKQTSTAACYRIPSLITAPNGDLIAAIDERIPSCADLRDNPNINIVIRRSSDGGHTWTTVQTVVDYPIGQSASDPSMVVNNATNEVILFFNYMDVAHQKGIYRFKFISSNDNGKTWTAPHDITNQISKAEWKQDFQFITSGRGIQTRSGMLLHTLVHLQKGVFLFGSTNHGKDWFLIDKPIAPADESQVMETADGSWIVNSRVNGAGMRYVHKSADMGKTWTSIPDALLPDPGCNASIIRYSTGTTGEEKSRLVFANVNDAKERRNLTVRISYDEGNTWSAGKCLYAGSAAYASLTVLNNGDIGIVFEKDDYREIAFTSFSLEWLTDGRDDLR